MALQAHKEFSYWHPINQKMRLSTKCWQSNIEFNDIGLKSSKNFNHKKNKKRIAILGDSMTENIQVSNQYDFAEKLQSFFQNYEIINFSVASTGLADQHDIYNKLIKKFDVDYLFLFITDNDFDDNHISSRRPNRLSYEIENNIIIEYERDKKFLREYFSLINRFKRKYLFYVKDYSNIYKLYFEIKSKYILNINSIKSNETINNNQLLNKKYIYNYLKEKFTNSIDDKTKLIVFFNISNRDFLKEDKRKKMMKEIWSSNIFFDPQAESIIYLKKINKLNFPYMGFSCDTHYSELGAEFMANYVKNKFVDYIANK
jgi:hypothetical protein